MLLTDNDFTDFHREQVYEGTFMTDHVIDLLDIYVFIH